MQGKKKVLLIGANGFIGQEVTKVLIKKFMVRALIRSAPKFGINSIFLKFADGDATNEQVLEKNLEGIDIVVSAFGVPKDNPNGAVTNFAKTLITAMNKKGVKRLVWVGGAGTLLAKDGKALWTQPTYPQEYKEISEDHWHAYEQLKKSNLDWTIVNPPVVKAGAEDGNYNTYEDQVGEDFKFHVKNGNLAALITKIAEEGSHVHKRVGICDKSD